MWMARLDAGAYMTVKEIEANHSPFVSRVEEVLFGFCGGCCDCVLEAVSRMGGLVFGIKKVESGAALDFGGHDRSRSAGTYSWSYFATAKHSLCLISPKFHHHHLSPASSAPTTSNHPRSQTCCAKAESFPPSSSYSVYHSAQP